MYSESFPAKLKKARNDLNFTQEYTALNLNISRTDLSKYENGKTEPNLETLGKLADFYEVSIDWLLGTKGGKKEIDLRKVQ